MPFSLIIMIGLYPLVKSDWRVYSSQLFARCQTTADCPFKLYFRRAWYSNLYAL